MKHLLPLVLLLIKSTTVIAAGETKRIKLSDPVSPLAATLRRPIIFVPGTMGTRLADDHTSQIVWGDFGPDHASGRTTEGQLGLALPMAVGHPLCQLRDTVSPVAAIETMRIQMLPGLKPRVNYYHRTFVTLAAATVQSDDQHTSNLFVFPYDWRRSGDENAVLLSRFVASVKTHLTRTTGWKPSQKLDLIAHSGGTQIARYFLRYGGQMLPRDGSLPQLNPKVAEGFANIVLLGPPNGGTITSLFATANGHQVHPVLPYYARPISGSMPGIYQLIPRARDGVLIDPVTRAHLDPLDYDLWVKNGWGLANPDCDQSLAIVLPDANSPSERRRIALDHLKKCLSQARHFQMALDVPAPKPKGLRLVLVIGEGTKTVSAAFAHPFKLKQGATCDGDRTVPSFSASRFPDYEIRSGRRTAGTWDKVVRFNFNHDGVANQPEALMAIIRLLGTQDGVADQSESLIGVIRLLGT